MNRVGLVLKLINGKNILPKLQYTCYRFYQLIEQGRLGLTRLNLSMRCGDLIKVHSYMNFLANYKELKYISIDDYVPISQQLFRGAKNYTVDDLYNMIAMRRSCVKEICADFATARQGNFAVCFN